MTPRRRLQLAQRLADLFDQYQVYRSDWLQDWAAGRRPLRPGAGGQQGRCRCRPSLAAGAVARGAGRLAGASGPPRGRCTSASWHARVAGHAGHWPHRCAAARVVLFGTTHIPHQTLEAIAALRRTARC
jgi:exodeoxyribonuclease V gamma subunit